AAIAVEAGVNFSELVASDPQTLVVLGPGSTLSAIATAIGIDKTLLGVDAVVGGKAIAKNLNERGILDLLDRYPEAKLVVSPVGAQGFILGRGNLEVSPEVLRRIETKNVIVVATPAKLAMTPVLRVDTSDPKLDEE